MILIAARINNNKQLCIALKQYTVIYLVQLNPVQNRVYILVFIKSICISSTKVGKLH